MGRFRLRGLIVKYFEYFSNKDLKNLAIMYSDEVRLSDWDILANGKIDVLAANKNIFDSVETIAVDLKELHIDSDVATCVIVITINNDDILKVIDLIRLDDHGKIKEISAYKQ